jgi:hypothetical protein
MKLSAPTADIGHALGMYSAEPANAKQNFNTPPPAMHATQNHTA